MAKKLLVSAVSIVLVTIMGLMAWFILLSPYKLYIVHTGSMDPAIPSGSAVVVRTGEYHVGEVITFQYNGQMVTHRLIAIGSDGTITTKGDANRSADTTHVTVDDIVGEVVAAPNDLGWFIVFAKQPAGPLSIILITLSVWLWFSSSEPKTSPRTREPQEAVAS